MASASLAARRISTNSCIRNDSSKVDLALANRRLFSVHHLSASPQSRRPSASTTLRDV
eukprot:CAMPEP_0198335630 /NCGR_PEP_ID=MMETSP1450-20131203/20448_1 /TAXON_ID=753684 ORGANISM="Madagascaria erythrocladiodes, Strain CCMP3234" /NCGR_SAMPLE_ID=MMETSP1450 /ASSEMBLY_ACC=CAM_ASM_001115 /LENGTH=57 /DNA_ID=CAMNT_0044040311 /DNA_START=54 /DNA_END=223 /DNA_ORIENTATION=-